MQNQKYYTNNLILNVILLKLSTVGGRNVLPNKRIASLCIHSLFITSFAATQ